PLRVRPYTGPMNCTVPLLCQRNSSLVARAPRRAIARVRCAEFILRTRSRVLRGDFDCPYAPRTATSCVLENGRVGTHPIFRETKSRSRLAQCTDQVGTPPHFSRNKKEQFGSCLANTLSRAWRSPLARPLGERAGGEGASEVRTWK